MNASEIREVLRLVRPALFALYGQQPLKLVGYKDILSPHRYANVGSWSGWLEIYGEKTNASYVVRIEQDEVMTLGEGTLDL